MLKLEENPGVLRCGRRKRTAEPSFLKMLAGRHIWRIDG